MTTDVEKAALKLYSLRDGKWFEADLAGISQLKREVHKKADDFLFLRKGEDFGAFIEMLLELMAQTPDIQNEVFSLYFKRFPELAASVDFQKLTEIDWKEILAFYTCMTKSKELAIATWKKMKEILVSKCDKDRLPELRILCNLDEVNEKARIGWEEMGFQVRHYKDRAQAGSHRYYLTEKEYCFFIRKPDSTFFGFQGSDKNVISDLRSQFDLEWNLSGK